MSVSMPPASLPPPTLGSADGRERSEPAGPTTSSSRELGLLNFVWAVPTACAVAAAMTRGDLWPTVAAIAAAAQLALLIQFFAVSAHEQAAPPDDSDLEG